ncbi:tetratricopeptide repeat protein [Acetobacter sp.]|jgi:tetratricopeptide (TPR) repeat protein|uniref:tetratricopeptide repeat protein n=1 Tax=Acetobacter sp. TaxID=440 RepID=UPI0025C6E753|nr:tetratricopeptide repeat protein [Acetobacter sp.]MCH4091287.1 tetratricopeptide repeat protein [Acetobacter sp.]MCI1299265.1 tetratricopeptide repeat protein [Acetobacter sp.]MCI1316731.1 tetratricopeptide repeat protein [Acetobacter sp.]
MSVLDDPTSAMPSALEACLAEARAFEKLNDMSGVRKTALGYLARFPREPAVLALLGRAELLLGHPARALAPLARSARLTNHFIFYLLQADCLKKLGRIQEQQAILERAALWMPQTGTAYFMAGIAFEGVKETDRAIRFYRQALTTLPNEVSIQHRLGRALVEKGETIGALHYLEQALASRPDDPAYLVDFSVALEHAGRLEEALTTIEKAISLQPNNPEAIHNRGHLLFNLNRSAEALDVFDEALSTGRDCAKTRFSRGVSLLKLGRFREGWADYETRWGTSQTLPSDLPAPLWQGEPLQGCQILLHAEQGFGDSLQFIRFAPHLAARGAVVTVLTPQPLQRLFTTVSGVTHSVTDLPADAHFDYHCPLASLPHRLDITAETIPSAPYFSVSPEEASRQGTAIRRLMWAGRRPARRVIGLVWSGAPRPSHVEAHAIDQRRSMPLGELAPLLDVPETIFVSFQMNGAQQIAESGLSIHDGTHGIRDFADTAARLLGIDLLICVDTSIAHLAGGLGLPVWMMSRFDGCWRWLEGRSDTPWYPTMKIFRQPRPGDWAGLISTLKEDLQAYTPATLAAVS